MEITIDGIKTHYILTGEGPTVVLLHGWGANIKIYQRIIELIETNYSVIALDLPGFGETSEPNEPWDVDRYAEFVLDFLSNFSLKSIILMGHSFGCRVIIKLMNRALLPFCVRRIIICGGAGIKQPLSKKTIFRQKLFRAAKVIGNTFIIKKIFPNWIPSIQNRFGSEDYKNASLIMRQTLVKVVNEDLTYLLPNVKPEVLLIWGELDSATPLSDGKLMEKLMPNAGLAVIKNAGHFAFLDQPEIFKRILISYLDLEDV